MGVQASYDALAVVHLTEMENNDLVGTTHEVDEERVVVGTMGNKPALDLSSGF